MCDNSYVIQTILLLLNWTKRYNYRPVWCRTKKLIHFACRQAKWALLIAGGTPPPPSPFFEAMGWPDGRLLPNNLLLHRAVSVINHGKHYIGHEMLWTFLHQTKIKYHLMDQSIKLTELIETVKFHRNPSQTLKFRNYMKSPILCDCSIYKGTNTRAILIPSLRKHQFLLALRRWRRFARVLSRETSPAAKSEEKRMFSQAILMPRSVYF